MSDRLLTASEAADVLSIGINTMYKLLNSGLIKYMVLGKKKIRSSELDRFMREYEGYDLSDIEHPVKIGEEKDNK